MRLKGKIPDSNKSITAIPSEKPPLTHQKRPISFFRFALSCFTFRFLIQNAQKYNRIYHFLNYCTTMPLSVVFLMSAT